MPEYGNMGVVSTEAVWVLELAVLNAEIISIVQKPLTKSGV